MRVVAMAAALALFRPSPASASEPPATRESAQVPGDLRVVAIEQRRGGRPFAVVELRGGATVTLSDGDSLGPATVSCVGFDDAVLEMSVPVEDPRLIHRWRNVAIHQWSSVPLAEMGVLHQPRCPTALQRVEGDVAVFRAGDRSGSAAFVRLRAGDPSCGDWRLERVDAHAGRHGVVVLRDAGTQRRTSLASWRP